MEEKKAKHEYTCHYCGKKITKGDKYIVIGNWKPKRFCIKCKHNVIIDNFQ